MCDRFIDEHPKLSLHQHRVGRGHASASQIRQAAHTQCADQSTGLLQHRRRQGLCQPPSGGGLAIGTRHSQNTQCLAGVLVIGIGHQAGFCLEAWHGCQRLQCIRFECAKPVFAALRLDQAGRSPLVQGLRQILAPIGGRTRPGDERITGLDHSAVGTQLARHAGVQPLRSFGGAVQGLHQNDSSTDLATICGLTAMSGCTPNKRKVCCTVWLNTGAATSPP